MRRFRRRSFRARRRVRRNRRGRGSRFRRTVRRASARRSKVGRARPISLTVARIRAFPDRLRTKLTFSSLPQAYTSTSNYFLAIAGNDLFDPMGAAGSNQPSYFDTFMSVYNKFIVTGSRIKCRFTSNGISALSANGRGIVLPQKGNSALASAGISLQEQPLANIFTVNSNYNGTIEKKFYCPSKVMIREFSLTEPTCYGTAAASPSAIWYWGIYFETLDDTTAWALIFEAILEYDVEFFELDYENTN